MKLLLVCLFSFLSVLQRSAGQTLYYPEDDVQVLTSDNFSSSISNSTTAWVVVFYLHWCGDCQRFAPIWKGVATDIYQWKTFITLGAINCADPTNTLTCSEYEIIKYPALRYFPAVYENAVSQSVEKAPTVELQRHQILEVMVRQGHPMLNPYTTPNFSKMFKDCSDDVQFVFLVVEPAGSFIGAEVALDLHKTPKIRVRYAHPDNTGLMGLLPVEKYPAVLVFDRNSPQEPHVLKHIDSRQALKDVILEFLSPKGVEMIEELPPKRNLSVVTSINRPRKLLQGRLKKMGDVIFQIDLETTLRRSFKQEIATFKILEGERLDAFKLYLKVLEKYFPFNYRAGNFLNDLKNLTNSSQVEGWKIGEIVRKTEESPYKVFSSPERFLACEGSSPRFRGYPCGLWTLFHYLTVQATEVNQKSPKEKDPKEVLNAIHSYVKYFFACADCSQHFQKMAIARGLSDVTSLDEAVLWLWGAHNEVNERLKGDIAEDPEHPKKQFPSKKNCKKCYLDNGDFNKDKVLDYLKKIYASLNVRYIGSDTTVLFEGFD